MTRIGSPRVPSTVGSSLVTPVARNDAEPDDSALAARLASPAMRLPRLCIAASALCAATITGNAHHSQPHALAADRALPALPCFSARAASAATARDSHLLRRISTTPILRAFGPSLGPGRVTGAIGLSPPPLRLSTLLWPSHHQAPAIDVGRGRMSDDPSIRDALGQDAAQRIAVDIQPIASGPVRISMLREMAF